MNRVPNWSNVLFRALKEKDALAFQWGVHDCFVFAMDVIERISGIDYGEQFRGAYRTETGAKRAILSYLRQRSIDPGSDALGTLVRHRASEQGLRELSWKWAKRGNLALMPNEMPGWQSCLGVVIGDRTALATSKPHGGVVHAPTSLALAVWDA